MPALTANPVLSRLMPRLNQCPQPQVLLELRDAIVEFYDKTKLDRVTLDSFPTIALQPTYALTLPVGKYFVQAHEVRVNKIQLVEKSEDALDLEWEDLRAAYPCAYYNSFGGLDDPTWRTATATQPRFYYFEPNGDLRLVAIPETVHTGDNGVRMRVSLKPDREAVSLIDDAHWRDYADTFVAGTLSRLMMYADKPWTNFKLAAFYGTQWENGVAEVAANVRRSDIRNDREIYHSRAYA